MAKRWDQRLAMMGLCVWLVSGAAVPAFAGTQDGVDALQNGNFPTALRELSHAARQGDPKAQYLYGTMLKDGVGLPSPDLAAAASWYTRAAESGYADAQLNLGYMMYHGIGRAKDANGGVYWYRKAAEQGVAAAQYNLGKVMWDGTGTDKNRTEAQLWFLKAAEQGMAEAQFALSVALMAAEPPQDADAAMWMQRAANQGEPRAYAKMAGLYTLGRGVPKDLIQAAKWAVLAEGAGDPMARDLRMQLNEDLTTEQIQQAMTEAHAFRPEPESERK